jgi:hypothetical protein
MRRSSNSGMFRALGYNRDQQGIINRFINEDEGWKNHLENSRRFILHFIKQCSPSESIGILGSGWLLDIPLEELSAYFSQVYLFDILHPAQVKHKVVKLPNVHTIETDLTGYAALVYEYSLKARKTAKGTLPVLDLLHDPVGATGCRYLVSMNLLSQLDGLLCDFLLDKKLFSEEDLLPFRQRIHADHFQLLSKYQSCIISDIEEISLDKTGNAINSKNLIHAPWPAVKETQQWTWQFDSRKTYQTDCKTIMKIRAGIL